MPGCRSVTPRDKRPAGARWLGITRAGIARGRVSSHSKTGRQGQKAAICGKTLFLRADSGRVLRRGWRCPPRQAFSHAASGQTAEGRLTRARSCVYYRLANHQGRRRTIVCRRRNHRRSPLTPDHHGGISSEIAADSISPRHRGKVFKVSALYRVISARAGSGFTLSFPCPQLPPAARQGRPAAADHAHGLP